MPWNPYPRLPVAALKDLVVVTRVLYRAAREAEPFDLERLRRLEEIGTILRAVLKLSDAPPGTIDHGNAWAGAERAARELTELVGAELNLAPVLAATAKLVRRDPGSMV